MYIERPFLKYIENYLNNKIAISENLINEPNANAIKPRIFRDLGISEWEAYKDDCKNLNTSRYIRSKIDTHFYLYRDSNDNYWCYSEIDSGFVYIRPL